MHESTGGIAELLGHLHSRGVALWAREGHLHYSAPSGALSIEDLENLRIHKHELLTVFEESPPHAHTPPSRAPLAFSQLGYWHAHHLQTCPIARQVACAIRLRGLLHIEALRKSLAEVIRRHDALRTRILICDGVPMQSISAGGDCALEIYDDVRDDECKRLIEELILEPVDVTVGPLVGVRLLRVRENEHVLIVAMEHIISDAFSRGILLRDLFSGYVQAVRGAPFHLPNIAVQFSEYADWQRKTLTSWLVKHGTYWTGRLKDCERVRFPRDERPESAARGWSTTPLRIDSELRAELSEWCRLRHTTVPMAVFTAYVALVLRWCDVPEAAIQYQTNGRFDPAVENTIGYFASVIYLRIALQNDGDFIDLLRRVTEEYCSAHEHSECSYLEAQIPRPEFTYNPIFNWVPQEPQRPFAELEGSPEALTTSPVEIGTPGLENLEWDSEPMLLLFDSGQQVTGDLYFRTDRCSTQSMQRFRQNFMMFLRRMLNHPTQRVKAIALIS